jgi:hypothetical protein
MNANNQEFYQLAEVVASVGVNAERMQMWLREGYFRPSVQAATGSGTRNLFSRMDIAVIKLFKTLVENGIRRDLAGQVARGIQDHSLYGFLLLGSKRFYLAFIGGGYDSRFVFDTNRFDDPWQLWPDADFVLVVNVEKAVRDS